MRHVWLPACMKVYTLHLSALRLCGFGELPIRLNRQDKLMSPTPCFLHTHIFFWQWKFQVPLLWAENQGRVLSSSSNGRPATSGYEAAALLPETEVHTHTLVPEYFLAIIEVSKKVNLCAIRLKPVHKVEGMTNGTAAATGQQQQQQQASGHVDISTQVQQYQQFLGEWLYSDDLKASK